MKIDMTSPKNLIITGTVVVGLLLFLPGLGKGWGVVRYIADAFPTAYAAKEESSATRDELHEYLVAQKEALIAQEAYQKAQHEFANQLMQQQAPLPVKEPRMEWQDPETGRWWYCDPRMDCALSDNWWEYD